MQFLIVEVERALAARGIPFLRREEWNEGWLFYVNGEIVARGAALGLLEASLRTWWNEYAPQLEPPAASSEHTS